MGDFYYEDGAPGSRSTKPRECPFPECEVSYMRSALLKRHLHEEHNLQNMEDFDLESKKDVIKTEPVDMLEIEHNNPDGGNEESDDRKVPPLRFKISQVMSQKDSMPAATPQTNKTPKDHKPFSIAPSATNSSRIIFISLVVTKNLAKRSIRKSKLQASNSS